MRLSSRPRSTGVRSSCGELDGVLAAEEVRGMQQVDVQRMALDPLAAVQQPPQGRDAGGRRTTPQASSIAAQALIW